MGDWRIMKDQAIYNTYPSVVEIIESKDCFDAEGKPVIIDEAKVATELAKLQAEWNSQDYARKRKAEYDQMGNQFEMIFDDEKVWRKKINEIKKRYPKK